MDDPLFEPSTDTTSDATTPDSTPGTPDSTPATTPAGTRSAGADAPATPADSAAPVMGPPTGLPVATQAYTWPTPVGAPTPGPMGTAAGTPAIAPMATLPSPAVEGRRSDTYRGLTIASFVLSIIAVLGVLLLGLVMLAGSADLDSTQPDDGTSGSMAPLTGSVSVAAGQSLPGDDLANAVEQRIHADGAADVQMDCPGTPKVAQGVVTVCHGQIEGDEWAVVVYFEDDLGSFTLNPL
jgi:hypothetical protein